MSKTRAFLVFLVALMLTGCSLIPTSGPVQQVDQPPVGGGAPPVDIEPATPVEDGTPDQILGGFLAAVWSGNANRFNVARQYLTPQAGLDWDPTAQVTVYDSNGHAPTVTDQSAKLKAPVLGVVTDGRFTAVNEPDYSHDFEMTQVNGQWRIGNPGQGIIISSYAFKQAFKAVSVYFFDPSLDHLLTETLYMNWGDVTPTATVEGLLNGPSAWLSPAAVTVIPPQTKLAVSSVPVESGVAQLSLSSEIQGLSESQKVQMVSQIWWTLHESFPTITGLTINADGTTFAVPGQSADGVVRQSTVDAYAPPDLSGSTAEFGLLDDSTLAQLSPVGGDTPAPIAGPLGTDWGDTPTGLAVGPDGTTVALTSPTSLWIGSTTSSTPPTKAFDAPGLTRPQINEDGVWAVSQGDTPSMWLVGPKGPPQQVGLTDLTGATVTAFRVAPDRTRVVVVANIDDQDVVGLMRIESLSPLVISGWRPLTVNTDRGLLATCLDVGWLSASQFVVLATTSQNGSAAVYRMDIDAASVVSMGPISDQPVALAVTPRTDGGTTAVALTAAGVALRYEDTTRWTAGASGLMAIALPG
ncbi:MAG: LpqB family beta-propeller domain-containing protein [Propionibacteriaceae bacterium]|nr:LpqB family beta-propeller domain-containing protein [Propionibacteriaceae bacterium]